MVLVRSSAILRSLRCSTLQLQSSCSLIASHTKTNDHTMSYLRNLNASLRPVASSSRVALRPLSSTNPSAAPPSFSRPSPPPLPPADQAEFEALLKANQTVGATPAIVEDPTKGERAAELADETHRDLRRGPKRQFEGDTNPKTGEVGGPKTDPFIAGDGDWQYGGRITVRCLELQPGE